MGKKEWTPLAVLLALVAGAARVTVRIMEANEDQEESQPLANLNDQNHRHMQQRMDDINRRINSRPSFQRPEVRPMEIEYPRIETPDYTRSVPPQVQLPRVQVPQVHQPNIPNRSSVPRPQTPAEITGRTRPRDADHQGGAATAPGGTHEPTPPEAEHETPRDLALIFSPRPLMSEIENYERWEVSTDEYEQYLTTAVEVGAFSVQAMGDFVLKGSNSRRASWDVRGGLPGVGLDLVVEAMQPGDATLTSPVLEDGESVQVFRFGRREQRIRNGAEIRYQEVNGLMVWRVLVPANAGSKLATCYYAAIADEQMIVLTARYNAERPEQMIGFDTIARTITLTE